jgi:periplasmic protein TonB
MVRFVASLGLGLAVALALFLLMNFLIKGGSSFQREAQSGSMVDFVRVERETTEQLKERQIPRRPPPPQEPPPPPRLDVSDTNRPPPTRLNMLMPNIIGTLGDGGGPFLGGFGGQGNADGDVIPIFRVPPQYPREAAMKGWEGVVTVRFTITEDGSVEDPVVIDTTNRVFNRDALRAILRWKFRARIVDGRPVRREATTEIGFTLEPEDDG